MNKLKCIRTRIRNGERGYLCNRPVVEIVPVHGTNCHGEIESVEFPFCAVHAKRVRRQAEAIIAEIAAGRLKAATIIERTFDR